MTVTTPAFKFKFENFIYTMNRLSVQMFEEESPDFSVSVEGNSRLSIDILTEAIVQLQIEENCNNEDNLLNNDGGLTSSKKEKKYKMFDK